MSQSPPVTSRNRQKASVSARPAVIQGPIYPLTLSNRAAVGWNGFFPPVKYKSPSPPNYPSTEENRSPALQIETSTVTSGKQERLAQFPLELRPALDYSAGHLSPGNLSCKSPRSFTGGDSVVLPPKGAVNPRIYPNLLSTAPSDRYFDLSGMPPPMTLAPKGDSPWVYRFKVKRNMNELSRIMASKPPSVPQEQLVIGQS